MNLSENKTSKLIEKINSFKKIFSRLFNVTTSVNPLKSVINSETEESLTEWEKKVLERKEKTTEAKKAWEKKQIESKKNTDTVIKNEIDPQLKQQQ